MDRYLRVKEMCLFGDGHRGFDRVIEIFLYCRVQGLDDVLAKRFAYVKLLTDNRNLHGSPIPG